MRKLTDREYVLLNYLWNKVYLTFDGEHGR